jgi:hypothetical protein
MTDFPSDNAINEALEKVYARPEFQSWFNDLSSRFFAWLADLLSGINVGSLEFIPYAIVIIFLILLAVGAGLLVFAIMRRRNLRKQDSKVSYQPDFDPWLESKHFAEEGAFEKATIFLFIWYLKLLDQDKLIALEKGKTNYQYELELIENAYPKLDRFRTFKTIYAAVRYGNRRIGQEDFENWQSFCLSHKGA